MLLLSSNIIPSEFFTSASLATITGATGAVFIICGTIQKVFNYNPKWLALVISIAISFLGVCISKSDEVGFTKYIIALLNGFLIYTTATGTNQIMSNVALTSSEEKDSLKKNKTLKGLFSINEKERSFFSSWWN